MQPSKVSIRTRKNVLNRFTKNYPSRWLYKMVATSTSAKIYSQSWRTRTKKLPEQSILYAVARNDARFGSHPLQKQNCASISQLPKFVGFQTTCQRTKQSRNKPTNWIHILSRTYIGGEETGRKATSAKYLIEFCEQRPASLVQTTIAAEGWLIEVAPLFHGHHRLSILMLEVK